MPWHIGYGVNGEMFAMDRRVKEKTVQRSNMHVKRGSTIQSVIIHKKFTDSNKQ